MTQCLVHQLNILWQNAISGLYIFDHPRVNISLGSILERFMPQSKVDHSEIWSFVKCGFLPSSCISQFANMAIICKQCKLRIEDIRHSFVHRILDLNTCWFLTVYAIKCRAWFNDDNTDIRWSIYMTLNMLLILFNHDKSKGLISVSVQNVGKPHLHSPWSRAKIIFRNAFCCWDWNISGEKGQFCGCWCPRSSHRQLISSQGND